MDTLIGPLVVDLVTQNKTAKLRPFSSKTVLEYGKKYVGCSFVGYYRRTTGMSVLRLYNCREFTFGSAHPASLSYIFQMYRQADPTMAYSALITKYFDLIRTTSANVAYYASLEEQIQQYTTKITDLQLDPVTNMYTIQTYESLRATIAAKRKTRDATVQNSLNRVSAQIASGIATATTLEHMNSQSEAQTLFGAIATGVRDAAAYSTKQCATVSIESNYTASADCSASTTVVMVDEDPLVLEEEYK